MSVVCAKYASLATPQLSHVLQKRMLGLYDGIQRVIAGLVRCFASLPWKSSKCTFAPLLETDIEPASVDFTIWRTKRFQTKRFMSMLFDFPVRHVRFYRYEDLQHASHRLWSAIMYLETCSSSRISGCLSFAIPIKGGLQPYRYISSHTPTASHVSQTGLLWSTKRY